MSPSYQTIPPANAPKDEPSSTPVPMMKQVVIAAMVGTAMIDIATTTTTTANLVRGGVSNDDPCYGKNCNDPCYDKNPNEKVCTERVGCYFYPHWGSAGICDSSSGVNCGGHRATECVECPYYEKTYKVNYCNGECKWSSTWLPLYSICDPK